MSITNYSELQTAVKNWLNRADLDNRIPEFIALAEHRINRQLYTKGNEGRATTSMVPGQQYYSLPDDFLQARNVQMSTASGVKALDYRTPAQMDWEYPSDASAEPMVFTIIGDEIQLKPVPGGTNTFELAYFKKLDPLSVSNTTNWLTANAPDLLLYGALLEAEPFLFNDQRVAVWNGLFDRAIGDINYQEQNGRYSGSQLNMRPDIYYP